MEYKKIEIIGSLFLSENQQLITDTIEQALSVTVQKGSGFEGRPCTQLLVTDNYVIKLRTELRFNERDAKRWIEKQLHQERLWAIHHPSKTWFLLYKEQEIIIANITKRLIPINNFLSLSNNHPQYWQKILSDIIDMYLKCASSQQRALDDGLSNYGLDENHQVFYLDDETYESNQLISLSHGLAVWIRQLSWLQSEDGSWLGDCLHKKIQQYFHDPHWLFVFKEQFSDAFFADERQRQVAKYLTISLIPAKKKSSSSSQISSLPIELNPSEPLALLGDIHSNLPALEATLKHLQQLGIKQGIILGDVVGYGPHPKECIAKLRELRWPIIKGNHDHGLSILTSTRGFSQNAIKVLEWSAQQVDQEDKDWLLNQPPYLEFNDWMAVHGAPMDIQYMYGYVYSMTYNENLDAVVAKNKRICFHGHSHIQGIYYRKGGHDFDNKQSKVSLKGYDAVLVCPGSVGQPRSGFAGAEFAVYYPKDNQIEFHRVTYNMNSVLNKMAEENFPAPLIARLLQGT